MKIKKKSNAVRVPPLKKAIRVKRKSSDIGEESTVSKAIENVKKVLEKKNSTPKKETLIIHNATSSKAVPPGTKSKKKDSSIEKNEPRGIVYIGHIPHGFYEEEMADYFKQFGKVTRVRVARSKNTGRSRGYGYVEFKHEEVAKVAAETMNNYLMCGRLLKATYITPEKRHKRFFAGAPWTKEMYPKSMNRRLITKVRNESISIQKHNRFARSTKDKLSHLEQKLKEKGIQISFSPIVKSK